jgi:Tfp pilus assembly protein PilP
MIRQIPLSMRLSSGLLIFLLVCGTKTAIAEEKEMSVEDFLESQTTVKGAVMRRDPFVAAPPPFPIPQEVNGEIQSNVPLLERYPLADYEVVATLIGDKYPRALVRLPNQDKKKVVIVKLQDKIGNRKGVVIKITREGVIVRQSVRSKFGFIDKTEDLLRVGAVSEKQKAALMASQNQQVLQQMNSLPGGGGLPLQSGMGQQNKAPMAPTGNVPMPGLGAPMAPSQGPVPGSPAPSPEGASPLMPARGEVRH